MREPLIKYILISTCCTGWMFFDLTDLNVADSLIVSSIRAGRLNAAAPGNSSGRAKKLHFQPARGDRLGSNDRNSTGIGQSRSVLLNTGRFGEPSILGARYAEFMFSDLTDWRRMRHRSHLSSDEIRLSLLLLDYKPHNWSGEVWTSNFTTPVPRLRPMVTRTAMSPSIRPLNVGRLPVPIPRSSLREEVIANIELPQRRKVGIRSESRPNSSQSRVPAAIAYAPARISRPGQAAGAIGRLFGSKSYGTRLLNTESKLAVYDISAATVHLPNGERLEAHSGLGKMRDNPDFVHVKNKGSTPQNIYNLIMRESRFHGAEAIRLLPADGKKKYNRDGLLAHPYLYKGAGGRGQSNGCVVFRNYERFLAAFKSGKIRKLIVVSSLDELPTYIAAMESSLDDG